MNIDMPEDSKKIHQWTEYMRRFTISFHYTSQCIHFLVHRSRVLPYTPCTPLFKISSENSVSDIMSHSISCMNMIQSSISLEEPYRKLIEESPLQNQYRSIQAQPNACTKLSYNSICNPSSNRNFILTSTLFTF